MASHVEPPLVFVYILEIYSTLLVPLKLRKIHVTLHKLFQGVRTRIHYQSQSECKQACHLCKEEDRRPQPPPTPRIARTWCDIADN